MEAQQKYQADYYNGNMGLFYKIVRPEKKIIVQLIKNVNL